MTCPRISITTFKKALITTLFAVELMIVPANAQETQNFISLETEVLTTPTNDLDALEHRIAKLMQLHSSSSEAHYLMSILLLRAYLSQPMDVSLLRQSAALAAQAYELNPKTELGVLALAQVLDSSGELDRGLQLLNDLEKRHIPLSWRYHYVKATLLSGIEKNTEAMEEIVRALSKEDSNRSVLAPVAISILSTSAEIGNPVQLLSRLNDNYPCLDFQIALASIYVQQRNQPLATKMIHKIQQDHPQRGESYVLEAMLALNTRKDYKTAKALLMKASALQIRQNLGSDIALTLALCHLGLNNSTINFKVLVDAVKDASRAESAMIVITSTLNSQRRYSDMLNFLEILQEEVPGIASSYGIKGELFLTRLGKPSEAANSFSAAIVLDQGNTRYHNGRGLAYYEMKKLDLALQDFEFAAINDPADGSARYNFACVLALKGRTKDAMLALSSAINIDPSFASKARADQDFSSLYGNKDFQNLVMQEGTDAEDLASFAH